MFNANSLLILLSFAAIAWWWRGNLAAREQATAVAARTCRQVGVQLLDQTVSIAGFGLGRSPRGLRLRRRYQFEFSSDGSSRHPGRVEMLGMSVLSVQLDGPTGVVHSDSSTLDAQGRTVD